MGAPWHTVVELIRGLRSTPAQDLSNNGEKRVRAPDAWDVATFGGDNFVKDDFIGNHHREIGNSRTIEHPFHEIPRRNPLPRTRGIFFRVCYRGNPSELKWLWLAESRFRRQDNRRSRQSVQDRDSWTGCTGRLLRKREEVRTEGWLGAARWCARNFADRRILHPAVNVRGVEKENRR